jgi:choline dehydrogenase-like flavoprotein
MVELMKDASQTAGDFDAIVIGSGISGGWAAKELTERGLRTCVIERGQPMEHGVGYVGEHKPTWERPFRGVLDRDLVARDYFLQGKHAVAFEDTNLQFWHKDSDSPYIYDEAKPFLWRRAGALGGKSLLWGRHSYRLSDLDFDANRNDGHGVDWPIRYADLAPWYAHAERFIGVSGKTDGLPHVPDGVYQPPMELNAGELLFQRAMRSAFPDRTVTIGRVAVLTEAIGDRQPCHYCGPCHRGCSTGSYFSSLSSTLPAAQATGLLTILTDSVVTSLDHDAATGRVTAVRVIDAKTMTHRRYSAPIVFLCASTVASTQILLNSPSEHFPHGLANRSGALGRYLMDHIYGPNVVGLLPDLKDRYFRGNRPNMMIVPRFQNLEAGDRRDFVRGYSYQGMALPLDWQQMMNRVEVPFGAEYKAALRQPGPWRLRLRGFGEMLPHADNVMTIDDRRPDRYGMPQVRFSTVYRENEERMMDDMLREAEAMLRAAGASEIVADRGITIPGQAIHEMGTARMGNDPATSVLNRWNQAHDVPNLFVTDGSSMTSSACMNPSLTYMALTARAVDHAVAQRRLGKL